MSLDPNFAYFRQQSSYWATLIREHVSGEPRLDGVACFFPHGEELGLPTGQDDLVVACRYWLTHTAFAAPAYWVGSEPPDDLSLLRGTRQSQLRQPARKGMILDLAGGFFDERYPHHSNKVLVGMGDASASVHDGFPVSSSVSRPFGAVDYWPIMSTDGGLAGIDF